MEHSQTFSTEIRDHYLWLWPCWSWFQSLWTQRWCRKYGFATKMDRKFGGIQRIHYKLGLVWFHISIPKHTECLWDQYVNSPLYSLLESFPKHIKDFSPLGRVGYLSFPGRPCICRESSVEPEFKEDLLESLSVEHALMLDDCYESSESCSLRLIVAMQEEDLDPPMELIQSYFDHLFYCKKCDRLVLDVSQNMCTPQQYISSMFPNTVIHSLKRYNGRSDITISPKRQRSEAI